MRRGPVLIPVIICWSLLLSDAHGQEQAVQRIEHLAKVQMQERCPDCKVTIEGKWIPGLLRMADSSRIQRIQLTAPELPRGYQKAVVHFHDADQQARSTQVQLYIRLHRKVPVVQQPIERGEVITAENLSWELRDITSLRKDPVASIDELHGQSARRFIAGGSILFKQEIQPTPLVQAGDRVQLIYTKDGVAINLRCEARESKAKGELIRVQSRETRKIYQGKVLSDTKIKWTKTL
ncbi:flagellar basal body P-ring formation chaperone FlgA [Fodinibius sediminis]|uniref:Flagella basal body P-ring formation protein FlgA n=1 Tax=Fodinibius sediminis TaxID=1214077 RepID=A0A521CHK7_9BACT|nr:flagellar basal body P-ring formation chaperone FlgA [Fodinibius sediminis]SMO58914.1 flagella basal body P-ring formation protein FlgA [Fodinibius sediminis]